jgi:hypothetical protein
MKADWDKDEKLDAGGPLNADASPAPTAFQLSSSALRGNM